MYTQGESRYIFLDNWVLSDYTREEQGARLSEFIRRERLTILITSLSMTELYNPNGRPGDRISRATAFLAEHRCVIVDPQTLFRAELQSYPAPLFTLPLELDLSEVPVVHRAETLELLLRRDELFLRQGKDIADWAARYSALKESWLETAEQIIQAACQKGTLLCDSKGKFLNLESSKEEFLATLDRRHFGSLNSVEREALGPNIVSLFLGETSKLPAVRLTSLYFWYAYVDIDRSNPLKRSGSDIGDFLQMSLIPYCAFFTLDTTMSRLLQRVQNDFPVSCILLSSKGLNERLNAMS